MENTIKLAFNIGQAIAKGKQLFSKATTRPPSTLRDIAKTPFSKLTTKQKLLGTGAGAGAGLAAAYGATELLENAGLREALSTLMEKQQLKSTYNLDTGSEAFSKLLDKAQSRFNTSSIENLTEGLQDLGNKKQVLEQASNKLDLVNSLGKFFRESTEQYRPGAEELGYLKAKSVPHKAVKGVGAITSLVPGAGTAVGVSADMANIAGQIDASNRIATGRYLGIEEGYLKTLQERVRDELAESTSTPFKQIKSTVAKQLEELGRESSLRSENLVGIKQNLQNPQKIKEIFKGYRDSIGNSQFPSFTPEFKATTQESLRGIPSILDDIKTRAPEALRRKAEMYGITGKPLEIARALADEADMVGYTGLPPEVKSIVVDQIKEKGTQALTDEALEKIVETAIKKNMSSAAGERLLRRLFSEGTQEVAEGVGKKSITKLLGTALDGMDALDTGKLISYLDGKPLKEIVSSSEFKGLGGGFQLSTPPAVAKAIQESGLAYNKAGLTSTGKSILNALRSGRQAIPETIPTRIEGSPHMMLMGRPGM